MLRTALLLGVVVLVPLAAAAGEITPPSSIQSVTVYALGASVTRTVPVALPAGDSTVILPTLPGEIETDSVTVEGSGDQAIEIGSVATRLIPADAAKDPRREALLDEIEALEDRLGGIGDRIGALESRRQFITKLAETLPGGFSKALSGWTRGNAEAWGTASQLIGDDLAKVAEAIRALRIEERSLNEDIEEKRLALGELPPPRDHMEVRIALAAAAAATANLKVSYRVPSARWVPAYDALLQTNEASAKPLITLVRRAEVTQATGEDWTDVALSLSTARPAGGTAVPLLDPALVTFAPDYDTLSSRSRSDGPMAPAPASEAFSDAKAAGAADQAVTIAEAAADFGDFRAEFRIPGEVSVATDVGARTLRIASEEVAGTLEVRAAPALSPSAFLHAHFTAPAGAPLLAGRIALFRDGAFVGSGAVEFVSAGADIDLGFGLDDRVKVTRTALDRATGETGLLSTRKTDTRSFRITVENLHKQAIGITVLDRIPYAEDEQITVTRLPDSTAPTAEDVDDRKGVVAWTYTYQPGESRDIQNAYEISWPADQSINFAE